MGGVDGIGGWIENEAVGDVSRDQKKEQAIPPYRHRKA
jgi:hypothetical protein